MLKPYKFVGSDRTFYIPDDILVEVTMIENSHTRSYDIYTAQTKDTWHDTGTNGSTADGQRTWLRTKPSSNVSGFNFAADGVNRTVNGKVYRGKIIQLTPLNEVTWAAGTPTGNRISYHTEQCFGGANVWTNSLYVNASLHGAICAAKGWNVDTALVQHNYWYGKDCPGQIRARGLWGTAVGMVKTAYANARAAVGSGGGAVEIPTSMFSKPSPIMVDGKKWMGESDVTVNNVQFFEDPRTVTTINAVVNIRVYASSQSDQTGQPVLANTPVKVVGWCHGEKVGDEDRWWITEYSHSRMWVGGTVEKPEDRVVVEEPQPDTDGSFVNVNGQIYYPVNEEIREVEVKNDAVLYKYATFGSEKVGEVKKGDVIKVAYWCLGDEQAEEEVWWILDDPQGRNDISYGARVHATDTMDRPE